MLYSLLNDNFTPDQSLQKVFYIQPKAILKLFKLKVGNERVSSQHIVQRMIRRLVNQKPQPPKIVKIHFPSPFVLGLKWAMC